MKLINVFDSSTGVKKILIYGAAFTGKTTIVGELAEKYDLIWFDLESGHSVLRNLPLSYQEKITLIPILDTPSNPIAISTLRKVVKGAGSVCDTHGLFNCQACIKNNASLNHLDFSPAKKEENKNKILVIDSLTQLTSSAINFVCLGKDDDYKLTHNDWGKVSGLLETFLGFLRVLQVKMACISHEKELEMEDKRKLLAPVTGSSTFSRKIGRSFDELIYAEVKNKKHYFYSSTTSSLSAVAGSRSNILIEKMDKPSLLPFFE